MRRRRLRGEELCLVLKESSKKGMLNSGWVQTLQQVQRGRGKKEQVCPGKAGEPGGAETQEVSLAGWLEVRCIGPDRVRSARHEKLQDTFPSR